MAGWGWCGIGGPADGCVDLDDGADLGGEGFDPVLPGVRGRLLPPGVWGLT